jgi:3'-phosphoadenosine 5'-phosphosulfate sulfotransferase (PAPS reductase)/FAD synthetase
MSLPKKYRYLLGAPFKISDKCCKFIKKEPLLRYQKETGRVPYIGLLAEDSRARSQSHFKHGCNAFHRYYGPESRPIMSWSSKNVWDYIHYYNLEYPKVYDMGMHQTGCMFCAYGSNFMNTPNRFQRMKITHPKQYNYVINKLKMGEVLDYMGIPYK